MKTFLQHTTELDNLQKWEQTQLLDGVTGERKLSLANLLESQRKFNETNQNTSFNRISIPLLRRIFTCALVEGVLALQSQWYTFEDKWNDYDHGAFNLDHDAEAVARISDNIVSQIQTMGKIAIHCLDCMDDGSIRMNYSLQH